MRGIKYQQLLLTATSKTTTKTMCERERERSTLDKRKLGGVWNMSKYTGIWVISKKKWSNVSQLLLRTLKIVKKTSFYSKKTSSIIVNVVAGRMKEKFMRERERERKKCKLVVAHIEFGLFDSVRFLFLSGTRQTFNFTKWRVPLLLCTWAMTTPKEWERERVYEGKNVISLPSHHPSHIWT